MNRIEKAYATRFRAMLQQAGARNLEEGVRWLMERARRISAREGLEPANALTRVYAELAKKSPFRKVAAGPEALFFCDAGLGGLARWLRAAGYEALWDAGIADDELLRQAERLRAIVLTTDSLLMERGVVRDGQIPAFWLPPTLKVPEQLALVFAEFGLRPRPPRCMSCGGELLAGDKEALRERIPPKTYLWLNDFFVCRRCGKLFWHGTHWGRIQRSLERL